MPNLTFTCDLPQELRVLSEHRWRRCESDHRGAVDDLTAAHRDRARRGEAHPVHDFLFTYYPFRPNQLRRWHPGAGVVLQAGAERAGWRFYRSTGADAVTIDARAFVTERRARITQIRRTLSHTLDSPGQFGCFGLHEWAMVYRDPDHRHREVPLRLGRAGTDEVVRTSALRCSHHDAVRFFSPDARPRNLLDPPASPALRREQPGCLHAAMDLYKWAFLLTPAVPGSLVLDCFRLAGRIRETDMRASPYDLRGYGYDPIPIETAEGKATYVAAQREFAVQGQALRRRLLDALDVLAAAAG